MLWALAPRLMVQWDHNVTHIWMHCVEHLNVERAHPFLLTHASLEAAQVMWTAAVSPDCLLQVRGGSQPPGALLPPPWRPPWI